MISLEQITCFSAVYELQSYSLASKRLGKARSTVRERIAALEDIMAQTLFTVEGKKVIATELAQRLYPRARLLARQSLEFENIALNAYQGELSQVTLFHDSATPNSLILAIEKQIKRLHPSIAIHWLQRDREQCLGALEKGEALLAIMPGRGKLHAATGIGNVNLGTYQLGIYTSTSSNLPERVMTQAEIATYKRLIAENDYAHGLRHTKLVNEYELVTSKDLLLEKLKVNGWAVLAHHDAIEAVRRGEIREVELTEAPASIHQECIMFYNLSSEASQQEANVIEAVSSLSEVWS